MVSPGGVCTEDIADFYPVQSRHGAQIAGGTPGQQLVFHALILAQFGDFLPAHLVSHLNRTGEHLKKAYAAALLFVADFINFCGKGGAFQGGVLRSGQKEQHFQKCADSRAGEGRSGEYREQVAAADFTNQNFQIEGRVRISLQQLIQRRLVPFRNGLHQRIRHGIRRKAVAADRLRRKPGANLFHNGGRVGPSPVDFIEEEERGHLMLFQQTPHRFRVTLHALHAADHHEGIIHGVDGAFHFRGKVHVSGGVQPVIGIFSGLEDGLIGENRDAPALFDGMRVQKRVLMIHPAQTAQGAHTEEHLFREGGLSRVHVGENADGFFHKRSVRPSRDRSGEDEENGLADTCQPGFTQGFRRLAIPRQRRPSAQTLPRRQSRRRSCPGCAAWECAREGCTSVP